MWPFKRTLSERYSKLVRLIKSIDSHFQITEDNEDSLRLHLPNYKGNQPIGIHFLKLLFFIVLFLSNDIVLAQRYTGYGRGMDAGDDWDFSPGFKILFFVVLIGICIIGGLVGLLKEKYDAWKEKNDKTSGTIPKEESKKESILYGGDIEVKKHSNNPMHPVVKQTWSLLEFARIYGPKMQVGEFSNKETGEEFKSCIFTNPDGNRTFVAFSAKMGELTPKEIAAMKEELDVVQLESGNYSLCKRDVNWEDVNLGQ